MNLRVDALGMVTALGHDAATSCAAIRAGLTRAAPVAEAEVLDPDAQVMVPVIGHAVWGLTEGKAALARWLTLGRHAVADVRRSGRLPAASDAAFWARTAFVIVSPVLDDDRFVFAPECHAASIETTFIAPLLRQLGLPFESRHVYHLPEGRTGAARAVVGAEQLLSNGTVDAVLVLAMDSYLDGHSLMWLTESERLKAPDQPAGLMPGEAAAAVLLTRDAGATAGPPIARIRAAAVDSEDGDYVSGERHHGRALARALTTALTTCGRSTPVVTDLYGDLNGEAWRAYEFGAALSQIPADLLQAGPFVAPAVSIGETGAASTLASIAIAARALERGYATAETALVTAMADAGQVAALVVARA